MKKQLVIPIAILTLAETVTAESIADILPTLTQPRQDVVNTLNETSENKVPQGTQKATSVSVADILSNLTTARQGLLNMLNETDVAKLEVLDQKVKNATKAVDDGIASLLADASITFSNKRDIESFRMFWVAFAHEEAALQVLEETKTTEATQRLIKLIKEFQHTWDNFKDSRDDETLVALKEGRIEEAKTIAYGLQRERFDLMKRILQEIQKNKNK